VGSGLASRYNEQHRQAGKKEGKPRPQSLVMRFQLDRHPPSTDRKTDSSVCCKLRDTRERSRLSFFEPDLNLFNNFGLKGITYRVAG
jgi:hypothetical protein